MGLYEMEKPAAIAAIRAAVAARTTTLSDGSRSLDLASLRQWVSEQGDLIVEDTTILNRAAAMAVLGTIDAHRDTQVLASYIDKANWQPRADWPTSASISSGQGFVPAVLGVKADMDYAIRALEATYEGVFTRVAKVLDAAENELALDAKLPKIMTRVMESRFYFTTHVTDWDEESANSPISEMVTPDQNDTALLALPPVPPGRYITRRRIYRSNAGSESAAFHLVGEVPASDTDYTDTKLPAELQEVCPTVTWAEPQANLRGIIGLPNGVLAGFFDNTVCFCEPFTHYAWPVEYQLSTHLPIVALGTFGQVLVVAHHGGVDYISGADSASMAMQKDVSLHACAAPRSMVSVEGGVVYASPDGLCLASGAGVQLITESHFAREDWQRLQPATMVGAYHERTYYFLHGVEGVDSTQGCYALHLDSGKLTTLDLQGSALYTDTLTDTLYVARGADIVACFAGDTYRTGVWRSKVLVLPQHTGFAWLTVESDFSSPVEVRWYGDGELRHTALVTGRTPVRLPAGRYLEHEIEVHSSARWNSLTFAASTADLQVI